MLLTVPFGPPLLATGMPNSDECARASVAPRKGSDCCSACRTLSPVSRTLGLLLLLRLLLLLGRRLLWGLRRGWWRPRIGRLCLPSRLGAQSQASRPMPAQTT